ncbi:chloramphenicol-sensitive protein RarD [Geosporobacter subterraneus DSM 17957]|uniref:Chloramphenicol-sensitive protein RarD n=1 Tax=Geosporobacter subterraneus DSM 17957 TaxID=1121919 RepID=A0A1M6ED13_9FIRM|nr:EamA family transporter RarD [Geosporobacter subterraneus]SHI83208.1 chloramphenicol-sensitive protein RarD [Geosporobacter subterraneus DSM 17957]
MSSDEKMRDSTAIGFAYGIAAYTLWGFLPLYWKQLSEIPPMEILAHRILWSFLFVAAIVYFEGTIHKCKEVFYDRTSIMRIVYATVLISVNWGLYIWAINTNHVVEASMGYYMNPLVVVLLGVLVLKEKLSGYQIISLILAAAGVLIITIQYGQFPWISLNLAVSFGLYGLMKKMIPVGSTVGLAIETAILMPMTLGYILFRQIAGIGALGSVTRITTLLLIGSGVATALPLLWFARAARRIPLSSMGFLQYISPSISLVLGVFVFKEQFTTTHFISFGFIWAGLLIYSVSQIKSVRYKSVQSVQR